jgi:hypothetical protein
MASPDTSFTVEWKGRYRIEGESFVCVDGHTGRATAIFGYPTEKLVAPSRSSTLRAYPETNTGSMPEKTFPAKSEIVPVGAIEVRSALRMQLAAMHSRMSEGEH